MCKVWVYLLFLFCVSCFCLEKVKDNKESSLKAVVRKHVRHESGAFLVKRIIVTQLVPPKNLKLDKYGNFIGKPEDWQWENY